MTGLEAAAALTLLADTGVPDEYEVTPGLLGFVVTFAVALVFLLLIRSFNKNMRKVNLNERRRQEAARVQAEADAAAAAEAAAEAEADASGEVRTIADADDDGAPTSAAPTTDTAGDRRT